MTQYGHVDQYVYYKYFKNSKIMTYIFYDNKNISVPNTINNWVTITI